VNVIRHFPHNSPLPATHQDSEVRELHILDALRRSSRLSQRELAQRLGISVGLLNRCVKQLIENGYLRVPDPNVRPFAYKVTDAGEQYRQDLTSDHYHTVVVRFMALQRRIDSRMRTLVRRGVRNVVFYGAGEIMDIALKSAPGLGLCVVGAIDDDVDKQGLQRAGVRIHAADKLDSLHADAVLITTFRHARQIGDRIRALQCACPVLHL
jgi:DNA-binding Lrp family transcriptional regulator